MATIEAQLTGSMLVGEIGPSTSEVHQIPEVVTDASGLSLVHADAYSRAMTHDNPDGSLTHPDDPEFPFIVDYIGADPVIIFGDSEVSA